MAAPEPVTEGPILTVFESRTNEAPPGTPAAPRPPGRPRAIDPSPRAADAFARELADRVLEYVRTRPAGTSAEQIAALVQQLLTRRPA